MARCTSFNAVWSSVASEGPALARALDALLVGSDAGVTFWRPQPPIGYGVLGDCATSGDAQPTFQARQPPMLGSHDVKLKIGRAHV